MCASGEPSHGLGIGVGNYLTGTTIHSAWMVRGCWLLTWNDLLAWCWAAPASRRDNGGGGLRTAYEPLIGRAVASR